MNPVKGGEFNMWLRLGRLVPELTAHEAWQKLPPFRMDDRGRDKNRDSGTPHSAKAAGSLLYPRRRPSSGSLPYLQLIFAQT